MQEVLDQRVKEISDKLDQQVQNLIFLDRSVDKKIVAEAKKFSQSQKQSFFELGGSEDSHLSN